MKNSEQKFSMNNDLIVRPGRNFHRAPNRTHSFGSASSSGPLSNHAKATKERQTMNAHAPVDDSNTPLDSPLLSRAEAAKYLRCSERHIDNLRKRGELLATLNGSRVQYQKSVLDDYIRRHTEAAKGPSEKDSDLKSTKSNSQNPESRGPHAQDQDQERDGSESDERDRTRQPPRDAA